MSVNKILVRLSSVALLFSIALFGSDQNDMMIASKASKNGDYTTALKYYSQACNNSNAEGCYKLAYVYLDYSRMNWRMEKKYTSKYRFFLEKACAGGIADACDSLGDEYNSMSAGYVKQDACKASDYYTKACENNKARSCNQNGEIYFTGKCVKKDNLRAIESFKKSCDLNDEFGCKMLNKSLRHTDFKATEKHSIDLNKYIGQETYDIFNNLVVQKKFKALTGKDYLLFKDSLGVSLGGINLIGEFYVGLGCLPRRCTEGQAAFAINKNSGAVHAIVMSNTDIFKIYGANSENELPEPLIVWYVGNTIK